MRKTSRQYDPAQPPLPLHSCTRPREHGYGLSCEQVDAILWRAGGYCEICGTHESETPGGHLGFDHDHRLGNGLNHVRGLLCPRCNNHMKYVDNGHWKPSPEHRRYVERAWFRVLLAPEDQDEPYFPETCERPTWTVPYETTPMWRRRCAAIAAAKAQGLWFRTTSAGALIWWEPPRPRRKKKRRS